MKKFEDTHRVETQWAPSVILSAIVNIFRKQIFWIPTIYCNMSKTMKMAGIRIGKQRNLARQFVDDLVCGVEAKSVVASVLGAVIDNRGC